MSKMMNVIDEITSETISEQQKTYSLDDGSIKEVYRDSSGKIVAVIHELFPGVHLVFKEIERTSFLANYKKSRRPLIVEHCWRGEMNSSDDKSTMYSSQGDIIIHSIDNQSRMVPCVASVIAILTGCLDVQKMVCTA